MCIVCACNLHKTVLSVSFMHPELVWCECVYHFQNIFGFKLTLNCWFLHFCHCFVYLNRFSCDLFTVQIERPTLLFSTNENYFCRYQILLTSFKSRILLRKYLHNPYINFNFRPWNMHFQFEIQNIQALNVLNWVIGFFNSVRFGEICTVYTSAHD